VLAGGGDEQGNHLGVVRVGLHGDAAVVFGAGLRHGSVGEHGHRIVHADDRDRIEARRAITETIDERVEQSDRVIDHVVAALFVAVQQPLRELQFGVQPSAGAQVRVG
tara:strand:+ start:3219 stop:3542 length:324 start_codon:yes stop_codon:yes gene_type:complete